MQENLKFIKGAYILLTRKKDDRMNWKTDDVDAKNIGID